MIYGGKFLKKLWCCVGGKVQQGNLELSNGGQIALSTQLIVLNYPVKNQIEVYLHSGEYENCSVRVKENCKDHAL